MFEIQSVNLTLHRTAQGSSPYTYVGETDWLLRETRQAAQSGQVFDRVRYWYANGRPSRLEWAATSADRQYLNGYTPYYLQFNPKGGFALGTAMR